jgi:hypothetical protein
VSLLQNHRRPASDPLDSSLLGARNPADAFGAQDRAIALDRDLDFSAERPPAPARTGRGPGVLVAAIVASSLTLAGIILLVRGDTSEALIGGSAELPRVDVVAAPAEPPQEIAPVEPEPAERAPLAPSRVASQEAHQGKVPASEAAQRPKPVEITPAAIAPASAAVRPAVAPGEVAPSTSGDTGAVGLHLPAPPVLDEPAPEPAPTAPTSVDDDASDDLPGIEEPATAPAPPADPTEPEAAAVMPSSVAAPDAAAPIDLDPRDRAPAHADRPTT